MKRYYKDKDKSIKGVAKEAGKFFFEIFKALGFFIFKVFQLLGLILLDWFKKQREKASTREKRANSPQRRYSTEKDGLSGVDSPLLKEEGKKEGSNGFLKL